MEIDNFRIFDNWFEKLKSKEDFYFVQVIQRKKDGVNLPSYTSGARTLRSFYFFTLEDYLKEESYIKELCVNNNARAYFWINPRNSKDVACEVITTFAELLKGDNTRQGISVYNRATGRSKCNKYNSLWIIDIDDTSITEKVEKVLENCRPEGAKVEYVIPTFSGIHLLTTKFYINQFQNKLASEGIDHIDVHRDNPTLLYYCKNE